MNNGPSLLFEEKNTARLMFLNTIVTISRQTGGRLHLTEDMDTIEDL
jgi:hypothetical protein